jgi:hypothetical protein
MRELKLTSSDKLALFPLMERTVEAQSAALARLKDEQRKLRALQAAVRHAVNRLDSALGNPFVVAGDLAVALAISGERP